MTKSLDKDLALLDEAINSFVQAMSRPRAWDEMAERAGVTLDRAGVTLLHLLEQAQPQGCHLSDIAKRLGIEAPSVTRKVQQLERQKLVERVADPNDRRAYVLKVTREGRRIIERFGKAKRELFAEILAEWPADDRHNFATLFYRLSQDMITHRQLNDYQTTRTERNT